MRRLPGRMGARAAGLVPTAIVALAATVAPAAPAAAQSPVREVQIPFDSTRALLEVGPDLRRELGLVPDVRGFEVARLFRAGDGSVVLEVTWREEGRLVRERSVLPPPELASLRGRVATLLGAPGSMVGLDRDGRGGLVLAETVLGLAFYGWAVPEVLGVESTRSRVAAYLLTSGAAFWLPYRLTRSIAVSPAHRDAVVWGASRGIAYGALLGDLVSMEGPTADRPFDVEHHDRAVLGTAIAGSVAGQVLGYQAVNAAGADRGDVALWSTLGDLGLAGAYGTAVALGLYDGEQRCDGDQCVSSDLEATRAGHAATLALGAATLWGAWRWSRARDYTVGDARALLSFGLLGTQVALPVAWALFEDTSGGERPLAASLVAGTAAGLWLGDRALDGRSLDPGDGLLVQAGHVAGGLAALGVTYLLDSGDATDEVVYMGAAAAGSGLGALLTFRALSGNAPRAGGGEDDAGLRLRVNPAALFAGALAGPGEAPPRVPLLSLRFR